MLTPFTIPDGATAYWRAAVGCKVICGPTANVVVARNAPMPARRQKVSAADRAEALRIIAVHRAVIQAAIKDGIRLVDAHHGLLSAAAEKANVTAADVANAYRVARKVV